MSYPNLNFTRIKAICQAFWNELQVFVTKCSNGPEQSVQDRCICHQCYLTAKHSLSADDGHRLYINLSYMLVFVLNILIFWIINSLIKKNRKLKEMEIVKLREQYLEQFIGNAESQYDAMRKLRHDIKDKYETVNELLKVQKIDETRKFISESFDLIEKSESYVKTKNNIVNAIVNAKLTMASSLGIKISCITVSDFEGIKGTDLCDLLSNTLENAITACKEIADDANKFLYLKIDRETDTYTFLIKNSIDHSVMDSNPRLTTTKADKKQHGLGTSIIREIARKYNGRCDFYESEGMFMYYHNERKRNNKHCNYRHPI